MQKLVTDFMDTFYGYGNFQGRYWFVGMEEGCGKDWDTHVVPRFKTWEARGRNDLEDARDYHFTLAIREFWEETNGRPIKIQYTWRGLIKALLTAKGATISRENIAHLQSTSFGRTGSDTCLLELLPLPSPNVRAFAYNRLADKEKYSHFQSRKVYRAHMLTERKEGAVPDRKTGIRNLIFNHKPRHVVFYGTSYRPEWTSLVNNAEWTSVTKEISHCMLGESAIWMLPHPTSRGLSGEVYPELGRRMRSHWLG